MILKIPCPCGYVASAQSERAASEALASHYVACHVRVRA